MASCQEIPARKRNRSLQRPRLNFKVERANWPLIIWLLELSQSRRMPRLRKTKTSTLNWSYYQASGLGSTGYPCHILTENWPTREVCTCEERTWLCRRLTLSHLQMMSVGSRVAMSSFTSWNGSVWSEASEASFQCRLTMSTRACTWFSFVTSQARAVSDARILLLEACALS